MKNPLLERKPKFTRSELSARALSEDEVRAGEGIPYLSARAASIPAAVADAFPQGKLCFLKDFIAALRKIAEALYELEPRGSRSFVMVERGQALKLALTLVLGGLKSSDLLGPEFNPEQVIKESLDEVNQTVQKVRGLLESSENPDMTIEKFRDSFKDFSNPQLATRVLNAIGKDAPTLVHGDGTKISLAFENKLKDLPSEKLHVLEVMITSGFDEASRTTTVLTTNLVDAGQLLFRVNQAFKILCVDDEMRVSLLLAQAARKRMKVVVTAPRCPVSPPENHILSTTLEAVSILEFENLEALRDMITKQRELFL